MSFADNLKAARNKKGLTQEDLAEALSVSRQAVSKWEQGDAYPEAEKMLSIAKKLNISLDWLFTEELASEGNISTQQKVPPGIVAGLETFASAIGNLMEQTFPETKEER